MKDNSKKKFYKFTPKTSKGGESTQEPVKSTYPSEAVQAQPLEVKVYGNNFDKALRAFRALVQKERILSAYKEKQSYEKPSDRRRRKRNEMKRKLLELDSSKSEFRKSNRSGFKRKPKSDASPE